MRNTSRLTLLSLLVLFVLGCASARERADKAYMRGDWDSAAQYYERAVASAETPAEADLMRRQLADSRGRAATMHLEEARRYHAVGDTRRAAIEAERAFTFGSAEGQAMFASLRSSEGSKLLSEGRAAHTEGRWQDAISSLTHAQAWAPSEEGARLLAEAQAEVRALEPADYRVTIHSAAILPFKPLDRKPWDGFGGPVNEAESLVKGLASVATDPTGITAAIEGARLLSSATSRPDCYVMVTMAGQTFTQRRQTTRYDSLQPVWNIPFLLPQTNKLDARVVSITVFDEDLELDDEVGDVQLTIGDLVRAPVQQISLVTPDGSSRGGGILVLKVSAERQQGMMLGQHDLLPSR